MSGVKQIEVSTDDDDIRLDRWFKRHYPDLSLGKLQKLIRTGQIRIDGKRAKANTRLATGQVVRIPPLGEPQVKPETDKKNKSARQKKFSPEELAEIQGWVIHKDDDVLVLNKPPGLPTQGGTGISRHLDGLLDALKFDYTERPKLVHRLDKDTSGVLLLARKTAVAAKLTQAFRSKTARKLYWAVVIGNPKPSEGKISLPLAKLPGKQGERMIAVDDHHPDGKRAVTYYSVVERASRQAAWLAMEPRTGRTHQLRVHAIEGPGTAIVGDGKYGGKEAYLEAGGVSKKLHLHARALQVPHPRGGTLTIEAEMPSHMQATFEFLGFTMENGIKEDIFLDIPDL